MTSGIPTLELSIGDARAVTSGVPLLETKFYIPRRASALVSRRRLIDRINEGSGHRLTLITAPAGFGKTTLLAEWLAENAAANVVGWVSLDATENDPTLFWAYVITALQNVHPTIGSRALELLYASANPRFESVVTLLLNDISASNSDIMLVLDDYHVIDAVSIHSSLTFLIDHLPARMRVVVASRAEPGLPLSRLRARGELTELRPADLRFTLQESSSFLNHVMGLEVSAPDAATLERRTEGWIAGLKLAALSMKGRRDTREFIEAFSGDNRYIADYLVDEVLQAETPRIRHFLLATSILDRLSGALCDAVTCESDCQLLLDSLLKRNLFIVALDDAREWYRYHHLFADVLQSHAVKENAERVRTIHRRASAWYEANGLPDDAIRHAIGARDVERAAGLLELQQLSLDRSYQSRQWLQRVKSLPDAAIQARPVLSMGYAWGLLNVGELEPAEKWLECVGRWLETFAGEGERAGGNDALMVVTNETRLRALPVELAAARVYAQSLGDTPGSVAEAESALALVPDGEHEKHATAIALVALAQWAHGELENAHVSFTSALAVMRAGGQTLDVIRGMFVLGDLRMAQGRLFDAASAYEDGLRSAASHLPAALPETDELHLGMSEFHRERNELDAAMRSLLALNDSAGNTAHSGNRHRWCTAMSRMREVYGDLRGALELLEEAERVEIRSPIPRTRPVAAIKARIWLAQGKVREAAGWASERGLRTDDELSYMREFEHITLARVFMADRDGVHAERDLQDALALLVRLTHAAEAGGRNGSVIETLMLQAIANKALGNARAAREPLERALTMAELHGYVRVFVDEGPRVRDLIRQAMTRGLASEYARKLLVVFDEPVQLMAAQDASSGELTGLLTPREHIILRHIAAGMRNQQIAAHLSISQATVKRHIANIYGKLDVNHRTEALIRAGELKLV